MNTWYFTGSFQYAICIDFVTTCWDHRNYSQADAVDKQEIIEFPAVLINLKTRVIEAEFHTYIRPTELPSLSAFCTSFTGVTQEIVNDGVQLADALRMFDDWIKDFYFEKGLILIDDGHRKRNTVLITWTDLDLGVYLPGECRRKGIDLPSYFAEWIDLRDLYSLWTGIDRIISFSFALKMVGIQFIGRPHSGADDSRNLARLVSKMIRSGVELSINSSCDYPYLSCLG